MRRGNSHRGHDRYPPRASESVTALRGEITHEEMGRETGTRLSRNHAEAGSGEVSDSRLLRARDGIASHRAALAVEAEAMADW